MATVVLVRPGCTDFDEQKRIQGALDLPLNQRGQEQLERLINSLLPLPIEVVLTGPCDPCRSTAEAIASALKIPVKENLALSNLDHGLWQGMEIDEVRRKFPKAYKQWEDAPETVCPPEGETVNECLSRFVEALKKPLRKYQTLAIIASEPVASLVSCALRGETPDDVCSSLFTCRDDQLVEFIDTNRVPESVSIAAHQ